MNLTLNRSTLNPRRLWTLSGAVAFCLLAVNQAVLAQDALMPRPEYSIVPPALQEAETDNLQVFTPQESTDKPLVQWGPVGFQPRISYRWLYGTGIPAATNYVTTMIQEFSPGFGFRLGDHWSLDYTPTWSVYSSDQFKDTLNHAVRLMGGTVYQDWTLSLSQSYISSSQPLIETATQTDQESFLTVFGASYRFNSRMSMDLGLNQNIVSTDEFASYKEWSTLDWLNYNFWERVNTAVGLGLGYTDMNVGSDMVYEQLRARVGWRATQKFSVGVNAGLEFRQFVETGKGLINPVFGASIQYEPFEYTQISLTADEAVGASYFENQATENINVVLSLRQRLLKILYLDLAGGFHRTEYIASDANPAGRTDDHYSFNARLATTFLKNHASFGLFYQYTDNISTDDTYTFDGNQVGFDLVYRF